MSLEVELNLVYFPEEIPPPKDSSSSEPTPISNELKQRILHQQAQIHLISIGPISQELLDSRLFDVDLAGVKFTWNKETKEYIWMANGDDASKPLPLKYRSHLFSELRKVGYQTENSWYRPHMESPSKSEHDDLVKKEFWHLVKKF